MTNSALCHMDTVLTRNKGLHFDTMALPRWLRSVLFPIAVYCTSAAKTMKNAARDAMLPDCHPNAVCNSMLQIETNQHTHRRNDGHLLQGDVCRCPSPYGVNCSAVTWHEEGHPSMALTEVRREAGSFTWYHHSRVDWIVQYKFCHPLEAPLPRCGSEFPNPVARITVTGGVWNPVLQRPHCQCEGGIHHLYSWERLDIETSNGNKAQAGAWVYNYSCSKPVCQQQQPCLRHYLDESATHTISYLFPCRCPHGKYCPASKAQQLQIYDTEEGEIGRYSEEWCASAPGWSPSALHAKDEM